MHKFRFLALPVLAILFAAAPAFAFGTNATSCGGDCRSCHSLKTSEAQKILANLNPAIKVVSVEKSDIGGLWEVKLDFQGRPGLVYIDYEKKHLVQGQIINLEPLKTDVSKIPLKDALVIGNPKARLKVIVFDDPV